MSHLCLHGNTSEIQRTALVGCKKKGYGPYMSTGTRARGNDEEWYNLVSAGLLDLAEYHGKVDSDEVKGITLTTLFNNNYTKLFLKRILQKHINALVPLSLGQ